jgi:hypothetical protein
LREQVPSFMSKKEQTSNELFVQTNLCCEGFLQNQINFMQAVRKALEEYDKEEVIRHVDQILGYYKSKLTELPKQGTPSNR